MLILSTWLYTLTKCFEFLTSVLGYPPWQEKTGFNAISKNVSSGEAHMAITELFNKKQALLVELQHYEANAASNSVSMESLEKPSSAMPTNTRLHVALIHALDEVIDMGMGVPRFWA